MEKKTLLQILFLTDNFLPHWGGSRVIYYNLCKNFPHGSVRVLTNNVVGSGEFDRGQCFSIERVTLFPTGGKHPQVDEFLNMVVLFFRGLLLCVKQRPHVIVCGEMMPTAVAGFALSRLLGIPYVLYTHAEEINMLARLRGERKLGIFLLRKATGIIAACEFVKEAIVKLGIKETGVVKVTPTIDRDFFSTVSSGEVEAFKAVRGWQGRKIILSVGRMVKRKNHESVIRALPVIVKQIPNVVYVIAGEDSCVEGKSRTVTLRALAQELGVGAHVVFTGPIAPQELSNYYLSCDVFVQPSQPCEDGDIEGFGIVFWEANGFGKPVIGPNIGGPKETILDNITGIQVDPADIDALAQAIVKILGDAHLAQTLGEQGRRHVFSAPQWEDKAACVYDLLKTVAAKQ